MRTEDEGGVDLGVVAQSRAGRGRAQRWSFGPSGLSRSKARQELAHGTRGVGHYGQIHDDKVLGELDARSDQRPVGCHHEGVTIEDQLVLTAHLVHVGDGTTGLGHPARQHGEALGPPAPVVRRRVEVYDDVGAPTPRPGDWTVVEPDVLTDGDAHPSPRHTEERGRLVARHEPPLFVEHAVIRQEALAVHAHHTAARTHRGGIGQSDPARRGADEPDHHGAMSGGGSDLFERSHVVGDEPRLEEEIFGRVSRDGQLRHHADVRPRRFGGRHRGEHPIHVARQVAHNGIELRGGEAQMRHRPRIPASPASPAGTAGPVS